MRSFWRYATGSRSNMWCVLWMPAVRSGFPRSACRAPPTRAGENSRMRIPAVSHAQEPGSSTFRPQLTSLVDVMTILLVFLIKSFSVEGNLVTPSPDLELPVSTSEKPPRPTCSIEITRNAVVADGNVLAALESFADADSLLIPTLYDWMRVEREKCDDTAKAPEVMIQTDKEVEFNIVKRVMYSCSRAGFADFTVLTFEEE
ncbi:MAG: hypothetical protein GF418_07590 [Chitinivibrionales bacterium]|nr:hypothetical protein [Chitinivibrionales bacterium]MBD3395475.1 hypothetical protein [Chitinivibrionales bacterium]